MVDQGEIREKRRFIRTETSIPMSLHFKKRDQLKKVETVTRNISATGTMVELKEQLPVGAEVKIDLNTPGSPNPVHCRGRVIWSTPISEAGKYSCGIEFINIEEDNKNTFLKFLCDTIYVTGSE